MSYKYLDNIYFPSDLRKLSIYDLENVSKDLRKNNFGQIKR